MKGISITAFFFLLVANGLCQKPGVDYSMKDKWEKVGSPIISPNGNFVLYTIDHIPGVQSQLVVSNTATGNEIVIDHAWSYMAYFSVQSDHMVFRKGKDSMGIMTMNDSRIEYIPHVSSFELHDDKIDFLSNEDGTSFHMRDFSGHAEFSVPGVTQFQYIGKGCYLLSKNDALTLFQGANGTEHEVWRGSEVGGVILNQDSLEIAFLSEDTTIMYYRVGMDSAVRILGKNTVEANTGMPLFRLSTFSRNGDLIYFTTRETPAVSVTPTGLNLDIWSYSDPKLQSRQLYDLSHSSFLLRNGVVNVSDRHFFMIDSGQDKLWYLPNNDQFMEVPNFAGSNTEAGWNRTGRANYALVTLADGNRKPLHFDRYVSSSMTPDEQYIVYYSPDSTDYFSYEIRSGITRNITKGARARWTRRDDAPLTHLSPLGIAGYLVGDSSLLIYDQQDIFQVDPSGKGDPINLTNGYGGKNNMVFSLIVSNGSLLPDSKGKVYLNAFDLSTKENGFYSMELGKCKDPEKLSMGPFVYVGATEDFHLPMGHIEYPVKAAGTDAYVVRRMSASASPNYFWTRDFKTFKQISHVFPEQEYNWLTSELVHFKTLDEKDGEGILYKPENFDAHRKYPVIVYYYQRYSGGLNGFITPDYSDGQLNLPWYVSHGYLVFIPDIHYSIGHPGKCAVNYIVGGARYLSHFPWVDSTRMGIQGHSFGGFETNYVVTHSHMFRAACSASGMSDFISAYGSIIGNGEVREAQYESYNDRIGTDLWSGTDLYVENAPVLQANRVTTPLLMMANPPDGDVPWTQGVEFFTALRRLGKKVWMLDYENGDHTVDGDEAKDLTIRMQQFFDFYLKGTPAPKWMVEGIPATRKGLDNGLELEPPGVVPGPNLLTPEEQKKLDALHNRKPITINLP